ncbi:MAG: hypothetical protein ACRCU1_10780, partial [Alsobacter sp.]
MRTAGPQQVEPAFQVGARDGFGDGATVQAGQADRQYRRDNPGMNGKADLHMALPGTGNVGERWWRGFARMPMAIFAAWIVPALAFQSVLASDLDRLPGRLVDTGTEQLHLTCTGQGSDGAPTVILEAGLAGNHLDWSLVQPLVSVRLRT